MPPPKKSKSSEILPRCLSPRKVGSIPIGHGLPRSRSGLNVSGSNSVYKPVATGAEEPLILSPSKRSGPSSPTKKSSSTTDSVGIVFEDSTWFNNIALAGGFDSIPEEQSIVVDSADEEDAVKNGKALKTPAPGSLLRSSVAKPEELPSLGMVDKRLEVRRKLVMETNLEKAEGNVTVQALKVSSAGASSTASTRTHLNHIAPILEPINGLNVEASRQKMSGAARLELVGEQTAMKLLAASLEWPASAVVPGPDSEEPVDLSQWGLPEKVVKAYQKSGVSSMFSWQAECLNRGRVLDGGNLVYSAPTSAGKTLVAEILLLKRTLETGKKGLFILPFVALAREKMMNLQRIFRGTGIRIGGMMGHLHPPGGLKLLDICVCTIEKANSLINKLVSENKLGQLGVIVVDELHMVGDTGRGYLIELLLTKVQHLNKIRSAAEENETERMKNAVEIIGMSATLPNLDFVAKWLDADLYVTDFRPVPLFENVKLGTAVYDKQWRKLRDVPTLPILAGLQEDPDHVAALCYETVHAGHGVLVFCPMKKWCETLADSIAKAFTVLAANPGSDFRIPEKSSSVVELLRECPAGLDVQLGQVVPAGVAFHHAGLTMDEREIIETAFRKGHIKVLIATTTLSSGVNLPARRVIIRSPLFMGKVLDVLTYYQMAGRAGRKGVDSEGESIMICKAMERSKVAGLFAACMSPVRSCLEPLANGAIRMELLRAVLEIVVNGAAKTVTDLARYLDCTLFSAGKEAGKCRPLACAIANELTAKELIFLADDKEVLRPSQLGNAVVWSGLSPDEGFSVFQELERARSQFNLETELHLLYLITPLHLIELVGNLDWYHYLVLWEKFPVAWKRVGHLVGVDDRRLAWVISGKAGKDDHRLACLKRFYCTMVLNELIHEVSLAVVSRKYQLNKGLLQSLQHGASTYSGIITIFCKELGWDYMAILLEQFQSRLMFGVQRELLELIRIQFLTAPLARKLFQSGYPNLASIATSDVSSISEILVDATPFISMNNNNNNNNNVVPAPKKQVILSGLEAMSDHEAAAIVIAEARRLLEADMAAAGFGLVDLKPKSVAAPTQPELSDDSAEKKDVSASTREPIKAQQVAEYEEIQSTQREIDEASAIGNPLPAIPVPVFPSTTTRPRGKAEAGVEVTMLTTPVRTPKISQRGPAAGAPIEESPGQIDCSQPDDEDDLPAASHVRQGPTYREYVLSCYPSVAVAAPSPNAKPANWADLLPSQLDSDFADFMANYRTQLSPAANSGEKGDRKHLERTPLCPLKSLGSGGGGATPILFETPVLIGMKRKMVSGGSTEDNAQSKRAMGTMCFDLDTRIDFGESPAAKRTPSPVTPLPAPPQADSDQGDFKIITVTNSCALFTQFLEDWKQQSTFSLSLACDRMASETGVLIGPPRPAGVKKRFYGIPLPAEKLSLVGVAVSWTGKVSHYICLSDRPKSTTDLDTTTSGQPVSMELRVAALRAVLTDLSNKSVIMYDLKRQLYLLSVALGIAVFASGKFADPKVAVWMLDMGADERTLPMVTAERCPHLLPLLDDMKPFRGHGSLGCAVSVPVSARIRSGVDAVIARCVLAKLVRSLKSNGMWELFESVEMPLLGSLVALELNGFGFAAVESGNLLQAMQNQLDLIERRIFELARKRFLLSSSDAVGQVLFVDLRINPPPEAIQTRMTRGKSKTFYSTNKEVLMKIQRFHPLPILILEHRRLQTALTHFVYPIQKVASACKALDMDRVYGLCFTCSVTGRISMAEPSLQNIPKDFAVDAWMELSQSQGRRLNESQRRVKKKLNQEKFQISLRSAFVPFHGAVLISADYSQLELRMMAHLAEDEKLMAALSGDGDVFNMIAAQWKKIEIQTVTPEMRQQAKNVCYGIIYGMGTKLLAEQLEVKDDEAERFMSSFKSAYPAVGRFIKRLVDECREIGYVETISGCRRYLPGISSTKMELRSQAERQAVNTTVQGSASNLAKAALVKIDAELRAAFPHSVPHLLRSRGKDSASAPRGAYLVLQLHDEFIYEVHSADVQRVAAIMERQMRTAIPLRVPLRVNMRVGPSWGALKPYTLE
ncbi:DNA polymerase theta [Hypsibius exemplaris]|uniref:DNA-directed DNA polymerase n=1 Tax=Hypsibius exemplaris TaxID=2072580 RepID=A0A1W0WFA4_HYPEX|nr:DNA polymerase theta [Hypsibius exemplaris]